VLRYFIRIGETIEWADHAEELSEVLRQSQKLPPGIDPPRPMSVTFIPAWVFDNPALLRVNPEYTARLLSLSPVERERLLNGNWKIRPAAGLYFKRDWCPVVDQVPADLALRACERVWPARELSQASGRVFLTASPAGASAFHY
jgi:hypothetical protein